MLQTTFQVCIQVIISNNKHVKDSTKNKYVCVEKPTATEVKEAKVRQ